MKIITSFLLLHFFIGIFATQAYAETIVSIDIPPASLEKWYKPSNKRQVWLHTMFRLRREMQAIQEHSENHDLASMQKWIKRLSEDYSKIADMVPEWEDEIKPRLLSELDMFAEKGDIPRLKKTLEMIQRTCDDCHTNYQPLVTAMYRSPHYDDISIRGTNGLQQSFEDNMEDLSESVNRILIALDDGHNSLAFSANQDLTTQLNRLGEACNTCHKDDTYPRERILGKATQQNLKTLSANISQGRIKDSQKLMGEIAVTVCARCHNIHRIVYDLRNTLLPAE